MRNSFFLFPCFMFCFSVSLAGIPIEDAIRQKLIHINIRNYTPPEDGNFHPAFYEQCIVYEITNLQNASVQLQEFPGRFLLPEDSSLQRMIITAPLMASLRAKETASFPMYAMCSEAGDGAPGDETEFQYGNMAEGNLLSLVEMIAQQNYQNAAAQQALWCLTDHHSPYGISYTDTIIEDQLTRFVCGLTGLKYDPALKQQGTEIPHFRYVDGEFEYTIQKPKTVDLKVYDESEKLIKDLADQEQQNAGTYSYKYEMQIPVNDEAHPPSILIRFYLNGEMITERKHTLSRH